MNLLRALTHRPVTVTVIVLLVALFGILSIFYMPVQITPTIDKPVISVETQYPAAAPAEVESEITNKIEKRLKAVDGLRKISSTSEEGQSRVTLEFDWGVDKDLAAVDVLKKINLIGDLPDDAEDPVMSASSSDEERPIMWLVARSATVTPEKIFQVIDDIVEPRLERIEGVALLRIYGGREREIRVEPDMKELVSRGITLAQLRLALVEENQNVKAGALDQGKKRYAVRTIGQVERPQELEQIVVQSSAAGIVRLKDVARVVDTYKEHGASVNYNGHPAMAFAIIKKSGANTIEVTERVLAEVEKLNNTLKYLDIEIVSTYKDATYIWESIRNVSRSVAAGAVLAVTVMWVFLRSLSAVSILSLCIPLSVLFTFLGMLMFGRSMNIISLAGLGFAAGMVVDNAIVVLENMVRLLQGKSGNREEAAVRGTQEVWGAILASTLTTLAVFIPVLLVKEESGQLFRDIALAIVLAVGSSLVFSITVIPAYAARFLSADGKREGLLDRFGDAFNRLFQRGVTLITGGWVRCALFITLVIGLFLGALKLLPPAEYLPHGNRNLILVTMKVPPGTSLEEAKRHVSAIEQQLLHYPERQYMFSVAIRNGPIMGFIVKPEYSDKASMEKVLNKMRGLMMSRPDAMVFPFQIGVFARSFRGGKSVDVTVLGPNLDRLAALSDRVERESRAIPGVINTASSLLLGSPEVRVEVDRARAGELGLTVADVSEALEVLMAGRPAGIFRDGNKEYDITLRGAESKYGTVESLDSIEILTGDGRRIPLRTVARIVPAGGPTRIDHTELQRSITINVFVANEVPIGGVMAALDGGLLRDMRLNLPAGYQIELSGTADDLTRTIKALSGSFLLAILITYLLMAALFESFLYPLIVMFTVLVATTGGILAVVLTGAELNVVTMLGFIILCGTVINNAILLVYRALQGLRDGMGLQDSLVDAVKVRIRPIFLTSLTSILGMLPLAAGTGSGSELYSGLGTAIIGGLVLSTFITLLLTPAAFSLAARVFPVR